MAGTEYVITDSAEREKREKRVDQWYNEKLGEVFIAKVTLTPHNYLFVYEYVFHVALLSISINLFFDLWVDKLF